MSDYGLPVDECCRFLRLTPEAFDARLRVLDIRPERGRIDARTLDAVAGVREEDLAPPPPPLAAADMVAWRQARGLSPAGAARLLGVSRSAWGKWERRVHPIPAFLAARVQEADRSRAPESR